MPVPITSLRAIARPIFRCGFQAAAHGYVFLGLRLNGWLICLFHAPSASPVARAYTAMAVSRLLLCQCQCCLFQTKCLKCAPCLLPFWALCHDSIHNAPVRNPLTHRLSRFIVVMPGVNSCRLVFFVFVTSCILR